MAEAVFNIVAKNDQEPHVTYQVQPGTMQKHGDQGRLESVNQSLFAGEPAICASRHEGKCRGKPGLSLLKKEHQDIQRDEKIVNERRSRARCVIANGNHLSFGFWTIMLDLAELLKWMASSLLISP